MKKKPLQERHYAIRIGNPRKHATYFMVNPFTMNPMIFQSKGVADAYKPSDKDAKVVQVRITHIQ